MGFTALKPFPGSRGIKKYTEEGIHTKDMYLGG